ncbi:unnamed protein product [Laminaria digitata]
MYGTQSTERKITHSHIHAQVVLVVPSSYTRIYNVLVGVPPYFPLTPLYLIPYVLRLIDIRHPMPDTLAFANNAEEPSKRIHRMVELNREAGMAETDVAKACG